MTEEEPKPEPLFLTATDEEWQAVLENLAVDPSIPILSDEAMDRETIYLE
jgi:hypothetical protein